MAEREVLFQSEGSEKSSLFMSPKSSLKTKSRFASIHDV
jgi:hypothetical protein